MQNRVDAQDLLERARRWRDAAAERDAINWRDVYLSLADAYEQAARQDTAAQPPSR